jgi:hypothetical protein
VTRLRTALRARHTADAGYTLVEVIVSAGVMSVMLVLFTTAVLQVFKTSGKTESAATAQSELQRGFQRFDREIRYASWIAEPAQVGTAWYVEFASADGTECLQLRLESSPAGPPPANSADGRGVLQLLRWTPGSPPAPGTPGQTVASQLVTTGVQPPFQRQVPDAATAVYADSDYNPDFQRLRIRLTSRVDTGTAQVDTAFTALNTTRITPATHQCSEGRPRP